MFSGSIPPYEAAQIIRATGSLLVRESPERRRQVFKQVHETLQPLGQCHHLVLISSHPSNWFLSLLF